MLGAIVGDVVGSVYEFDNIKTKDFPLFSDNSFFTDDTVMTLVVAKALTDKTDFAETMVSVGRKYPYCGYGGHFSKWILGENHLPYNSFGNGAAMRISPVAYVSDSDISVKDTARKATEVSHNHPWGIKGAEAVAMAIKTARNFSKRYVVDCMRKYYPIMESANFTCDNIRKDYGFDETCQGTVPQAFQCFVESTGFEDALRLAISLGGDSDTLAAITCSVAGEYYGIPAWIAEQTYARLDSNLRDILDKFEKTYRNGRTPSKAEGV